MLQSLIESDLALFENDFGVTGTFGTDPDTFEITGQYTAASQGRQLFGDVEVEAGKPSFIARSAAVTGLVRSKMRVVIGDEGTFIVERIEAVGTGLTLMWLKPSNG